MRFIDVNGDSLKVTGLTTQQREDYVRSLEDMTGLVLSVNDRGMVVIIENKEGDIPLLSAGNMGNSDVSETAKAFVTSAIGFEIAINVQDVTTSKHQERSQGGGRNLYLDFDQISKFIEGTPKTLDNRTMGLGLVGLHELYHTHAGAYFANGGKIEGMSPQLDTDKIGAKGPTVTFMNQIERELGGNIGVRTQYHTTKNNIGVKQQEYTLHGQVHHIQWRD
jgi:hypothetical protein